MASWTKIESDPSVFTELVERLGVTGVEFTELYSLDDSDFNRVAPVYGLIFLFKWTGSNDARTCVPIEEVPPDLFFAKQMVQDACATQAILSVLLNAPVSLGETLTELKTFSKELPYDMRGLAIENFEKIRTAHNSFARPEGFVSSQVQATGKGEDVFHFVAYVPHGGRVYELDGLQQGPVDLGEGEWLEIARNAISQRIDDYSASEIKFNLMAVVKDRRETIDQLIASTTDPAELADLHAEKEHEVAKREAWRAENVRRRHNYIPLIVDMLKVLAEKDKLIPIMDAATTKKTASAAAATKAG